MNLLQDIDCFLLDLDGTVYIGDNVIDGAVEAVKRMQKHCRVIFLTNNSSQTGEFYVDKLSKMGFDVTRDNVYTSANATADYILDCLPEIKPYVVASPDIEDEFRRAGVKVSDYKQADSVILTFDKTLTFEKLVYATRLISGGAKYIATHPDVTCPDPICDLPDIGSFIKLIEAATGRSPDIICGKPYGIMADCVTKLTGLKKERIALVGDRLYTDIKFAVDNGLSSVLVLSGETNSELYGKSDLRADKVIASIAGWDA